MFPVPGRAESGGMCASSHQKDVEKNKYKPKLLVLDGSYHRLTKFGSVKPGELLTVFADAAEAHQQAYHKANILHGDISPATIAVTENGRGLLLDWDVKKPVGKPVSEPCSSSPST